MKRINLASHVKNALPDVTTPFAKNSVHLSPWTHIYIFNLQLDNEARFERVRGARRCSPLGLALKAHNARLFHIIRSWQGGVGGGFSESQYLGILSSNIRALWCSLGCPTYRKLVFPDIWLNIFNKHIYFQAKSYL